MKVTLQNLTKKFAGRGKGAKPVVAVDNFNFEIPDGKLVGLLGPSGCGKSTALNLLCGLLKPTAGKIYFGEDDVTDLPAESRGVGMVFQNYALYPHLTVEQNITFPLENLRGTQKMTKAAMHEKAMQTAKLVQIDELMQRKPSEMSGGQQQRVAIARALVKTPRILLLDEPLSNLDARLRLQTREEIRRIQQETKVTTVFVTHDQEEAMSISDVIIVMKSGKVHQIGKPQDVYDEPADLFVAKFLGTPPIHTFAGRIKNGQVYIGDAAVLPAPPAQKDADRPVTVAVRPEGFWLEPDGPLECAIDRVEVMGRDITVVCKHPACENAAIRAIISAEVRHKIPADAKTVRFVLKPHKAFIFDPETGERLDPAKPAIGDMTEAAASEDV